MKKQITLLVILLGILTGQAASAQMRYSYDESSVRLSVEADDETGASDRAAFYVFAEGKDDIKDMIYFDYANAIGDNAVFGYDFGTNDYGVYTIRLTCSDYSGKTTTVDNLFYYNSPEDIAECVVSFKNVKTEAEFHKAYALYGNDKRIINIDEIEEPITAKVVEQFMLLRELYMNNSDNLSFESCSDVLKCIKGAVLLEAFEANSSNCAELFAKYSDALGTMYESDADINKAKTLMSKIGDKITNAESLRKAIRNASIFAPAVNGTEADMIDIINKHSTEIGADLSYASQKKVTAAQAVKYISFMSDPVGHMYNFGTKFAAAVDSAAAANKNTDNKVTIGGGGGAGSVSSIGGIATGGNAVQQPSDTNEQTLVFSDIDGVPWAQKYITEGYYNGVLSGMGDGRFAPYENVTREQFVKMLVDALKLSVVVGVDVEFDDVDNNSWYAPYVRSAYSLDITKGINEREFGTGRLITRQEMVALLYRAHWLNASDITFADNDSIAEYAKTAVSAYAGAGIVSGYEDNTFRPENYANRAEAAVMIGRLTDYIKGE